MPSLEMSRAVEEKQEPMGPAGRTVGGDACVSSRRASCHSRVATGQPALLPARCIAHPCPAGALHKQEGSQLVHVGETHCLDEGPGLPRQHNNHSSLPDNCPVSLTPGLASPVPAEGRERQVSYPHHLKGLLP